jgi:hypothetical protein
VGEARGVIPLPFGDRLSLAGAAGYAYGESVGRLDAEGNDVTLTTKQWIGDLSLAWQIADGLSSSLRYQYVRQTRNDPTRPMLDPDLDPEERTRRQQITLVLEGTYPTRQAVELPRDSSTRVDGGLESMSQREDSLVR